MHDLGYVGERDAGLRGELREALERGDRRILRRRQALVEREPASRAVVQHEIGEGAADVEADAEAPIAHAPPILARVTRAGRLLRPTRPVIHFTERRARSATTASGSWR